MKATAIGPSNIAFIKYWGVKDEKLKIPMNGSISMNLSNLLTTTTVSFDKNLGEDSITIDNEIQNTRGNRVSVHLDRIRKLAKINDKAKVVTKNNFPTATGLSSSASGYAALTVAAAKAAGLALSGKQLSILARQGSGSACRSIPDGFTQWFAGNTSETSYAASLYKPDYWDIVDVVAVVSKEKKEVSSTEGHKLASSSPFFTTRLQSIDKKITQVNKYLQEKNFSAFGELVEEEALELHAIYITSRPSLIYLLPQTLAVMHLVKKWRKEGLEVYFTLNTGQDIHLICQKKDAKKVQALLKVLPYVQQVIYNTAAKGTRESTNHLF